MELTKLIQLSKQTLYNGANKINTIKQINFIQWSKQTLYNGANKLNTIKQTKFN